MKYWGNTEAGCFTLLYLTDIFLHKSESWKHDPWICDLTDYFSFFDSFKAARSFSVGAHLEKNPA